MEQNDIQRLKNLLDALVKKATWELDDKFRKLLDDEINYELITLYNEILYYHNFPLKNIVNYEDKLDWRNRKINETISITSLRHFEEKVTTSILRHKLVVLPDELLILCAAAHVNLTGEEMDNAFVRYCYGDSAQNLDDLPAEVRKLLTFYKKNSGSKEETKEL